MVPLLRIAVQSRGVRSVAGQSKAFLATRKPWSIRFGTGEIVAEDVLAFDTVIHQRINLERQFLVARAHSGIANQTLLQEFIRCHLGCLSAGRRCISTNREAEQRKVVRLELRRSLRIWKSCPNVPGIQIMLLTAFCSNCVRTQKRSFDLVSAIR